MLAHEYINKLKQDGYIEQAAWNHIDNIIIYLNKAKVYKVVVDYFPNELSKINRSLKKQGKSLRINNRLNVLNNIPSATIIDKLIKDNVEKYKRMTLIYDAQTHYMKVVKGEPETPVLNSS